MSKAFGFFPTIYQNITKNDNMYIFFIDIQKLIFFLNIIFSISLLFNTRVKLLG